MLAQSDPIKRRTLYSNISRYSNCDQVLEDAYRSGPAYCKMGKSGLKTNLIVIGNQISKSNF